MKKILSKIKYLFFCLIGVVAGANLALAEEGLKSKFTEVGEAANKYLGSPVGGMPNAPEKQIYYIIGYVIQVILSLLTIFFFGLIIYGGYLWMTAAGNDQQVEKAKKILLQAIIGFVLVLLGLGITFMIMSVLEAQVMLL